MNETIKLLLERKSVRAFEDRDIPTEIRDDIIACANRAPTAGNSMMYSIIDVRSQEIKDKLIKTCDRQPMIGKAPMVLVILADYRRWMRKYKQAGVENIPAPELSDLILATNDAVIAAHSACVAGESYGIGSCYIGDIIENFEEHKEIFDLPEHVAPVCMLIFGYPTEGQKNRPQPPRFKREMIVFEDKYRELTEAELQEYYDDEKAVAFCKRKYLSDFSREMVRSTKEIYKNWNKE